MTTEYVQTNYLVSTGIQPTPPIRSATSSVPVSNTNPDSIAALDASTLAPLGLAYDTVRSITTAGDNDPVVVRRVVLRTVSNPYVDGSDLWQTNAGPEGLIYATQNMFIGSFSLSLQCAVQASPTAPLVVPS